MVNNVKKILSFNKNKETAHKKDMVTIGQPARHAKKTRLNRRTGISVSGLVLCTNAFY